MMKSAGGNGWTSSALPCPSAAPPVARQTTLDLERIGGFAAGTPWATIRQGFAAEYLDRLDGETC